MTTATVLLDTNVLIMLRRRRPQLVRDRFEALGAEATCSSAIMLGELRFGAGKSTDPAAAHAAIDRLAAAIDFCRSTIASHPPTAASAPTSNAAAR